MHLYVFMNNMDSNENALHLATVFVAITLMSATPEMFVLGFSNFTHMYFYLLLHIHASNMDNIPSNLHVHFCIGNS